MMRERNIADASELVGLGRLDLRALRRHLDGENARHRQIMVSSIADALDATEAEKKQMALAYMGWNSALAAV